MSEFQVGQTVRVGGMSVFFAGELATVKAVAPKYSSQKGYEGMPYAGYERGLEVINAEGQTVWILQHNCTVVE